MVDPGIDAECPYCRSREFKVVGSAPNRMSITIRCLRCRRSSELDVENPNVDLTAPIYQSKPLNDHSVGHSTTTLSPPPAK